MTFASRLLFALLFAAIPLTAIAQEGTTRGRAVASGPVTLPQRARVEPANAALRDRLDNLLPQVMRESGIDLWVIINREYAEDPVYFSLVPEPDVSARRLTMLLIHDRGPQQGVERLIISRYPIEGYYNAPPPGAAGDTAWKRLADLVRERNPKKIGVNVSRNWAVADGLTHSLHEQFVTALDASLRPRVVSAEDLVIRWMETRTAPELESYQQAVALARGVVAEAFSNKVITPGVTTTDDVAWYIRQRYADLDLPVWFMPYVNVQRAGVGCDAATPFCGIEGVIRPGDVLHTDVGITYLRMNTDTQEMGYVLRPGETEVPAGLRAALEAGNRWQDLLVAEFVTGRSGNEILAAARTASAAANIDATIYSHPIGFFGHAPGPLIGMWDNQGPTPVQGDWKLRPSTAYAIEGHVKVRVPEWNGQLVQMKLEQSAWFDGKKVTYLAGRQTTLHVVR